MSELRTALAELSELSSGMRHSAGQWMIPGWDGNRCANLLEAARKALAAPVSAAPMAGVEPVAWTLTEELEKRETTCRAHLWFVNPRNSSWTPLYAAPIPPQAVESAAPSEREKRWRRVFDHVEHQIKTREAFNEDIDSEENDELLAAFLIRFGGKYDGNGMWDVSLYFDNIVKIMRALSESAAPQAAEDARTDAAFLLLIQEMPGELSLRQLPALRRLVALAAMQPQPTAPAEGGGK